MAGTVTRSVVNHYADPSDVPAWITTSTGGKQSWTRNMAGLTGDLAATEDSTGAVTLQLANLHGDIVATAADDPAATGTTGYVEATEYGTPRPANTVTPDRYGWLGAKRRSTDDLAGLVLMGVRLYNPATGRFLQVDPVPGGSCSDYDYACQDPVNKFDLNGQWCWAGIGTTCTRIVSDRYGRPVPVQYRMRQKVKNKHGISWGTLKWLISSLPQVGGSGTRVEYAGQVEEFRCSGFLFWLNCTRTGRAAYVHSIVDFKTVKSKTFGLVTAYCDGPVLCPRWINNPARL